MNQVKYIGHADFAAGIWIGLELRNPKGEKHLMAITTFFTEVMTCSDHLHSLNSKHIPEHGIVNWIQSRKAQWSRPRPALLHLQGGARGDGSTKVRMVLMVMVFMGIMVRMIRIQDGDTEIKMPYSKLKSTKGHKKQRYMKTLVESLTMGFYTERTEQMHFSQRWHVGLRQFADICHFVQLLHSCYSFCIPIQWKYLVTDLGKIYYCPLPLSCIYEHYQAIVSMR